MKKNVIKTAIAAVCVVAAGMGGLKAYNAANQSEANLLLAENVEALSAGDFADDLACQAIGGPDGNLCCNYYPWLGIWWCDMR